MINSSTYDERERQWGKLVIKLREKGENVFTETPKEELHKGETFPWVLWRTINRIKALYNRTKTKNLYKWGLAVNDMCECGEVQDERHVL